MPGKQAMLFAADHPAFAGHFPGQPIVPGVLLLDAAIQAVVAVEDGHASTGAATDGAAPDRSHCLVNSAKFLSPVSPGETLTLRWSESSQAGQCRFDIDAAGRPVATGVLELGRAA